MTPERWEQVEGLFHAALEREPARRADFVARACAGDEALRREVESLVAAHERSGDFIEEPAADVAAGLLAWEEEDVGLAPGQAVGPYRVAGLLGAGGMGKVYLAEDTRLSRRVALKLLPPQFTADADRVLRFEREARAASALNHPNILTVYEIGRDGASHFIATEFVDGETLRERMAAGPLPVAEVLDVAAQVASALAAAHAVGVVHRDVKPENIMLRRDRFVKVLDFGLAKLVPPESNGSGSPAPPVLKTTAGVLMGTARYMSPEQARGQEVDERTDVWSLGVVLYEMLTARAPFEGETNSDVLAAVLREEPAPLELHTPDVPVELQWMVGKALAKDREERYQTARELQIDLKRLKGELELRAKLGGLPTLMRADSANARTRVPSTSTRVGGKGRPRRVAFVAALAAVVVAAIAASSFFSYRAGLKNAPPPAFPTFRQLTFRRGSLSMARFAPDGNTLVYSAAFDGKPIELFAGRVERPESTSLKAQVGGRTAGIQSISPQGEMALILDCEVMWGECHDGTLALMPLGGGAPREIMEDVYAADWSPDGKELAVVHVSEGVYQLEYPRGHVLYKAPGRIANMRVSPKGDLVAFIDHPVLDSGVGATVQVVDLNGNRRTLFENRRGARGLAWSPSGEEVWFSAADNSSLAIYAVTLSGQSRVVFRAPGNLLLYDISRDGRVLAARGNQRSRMITADVGSGKEHDLTWYDFSAAADLSADGRHVLFHEGDRMTDERQVQVFLRKADGSDDPVRLGNGKALALSPDGKWALALQQGPPPPQLVLLPTGPGEPRLLPRGDIKEYHYASFFPDGRRILFTGLADLARPLRSYAQDIDGGEPRPVTEEGVIALWVSPDGKRFVGWAPGRSFGGEYFVAPFEGGAPVPVSGMEFDDVPARWSADGRALYVLQDADYESAIYRLDLRDGSRRLVKKIAPDPVGLVGLEVNRPGSIQITPDGKSYVYTYFILLQELFLLEGLK